MTRSILAVLFIHLCGCSINPSQPVPEEQNVKSKKQYKRYIETVFRRQNQAMSQIILLPVDELNKKTQQNLADAEQSVTTRCKVLNEIASLRSEGKKESMFQKLKVSRSINDCDAATRELEVILEQVYIQLNQDEI
jgi:hypothetical protein